jgi:predicted phosphodiesterase
MRWPRQLSRRRQWTGDRPYLFAESEQAFAAEEPGGARFPVLARLGRMADSVAFLADVHAVLPALRAVLAEPEVAAADAVVLLGDLAAGPQPVETLDLLTGLGERAIWISGNGDRELVELARDSSTEASDEITGWAANQLRPDQIELLAALPLTETLAIDGLGAVLCCHATPRDDTEVALVDSTVRRWREVLATVPDSVRTVACGHTHMPFVRLLDRRTVMNPGSVGMPYGSVGAHWALLGRGGISLRRTEYDATAAAEEIIAGSTFPDVAAWVDFFVRNPLSDLAALEVFGPKDGRGQRPATMDITTASIHSPSQRSASRSTPSAWKPHFSYTRRALGLKS